MGKGTDLARAHAPEHAAVIDAMKEQLLIVFLKRMGGKVTIPVAEVDDTSQDLFTFNFNFTKREFNFEVQKKQ